MESKESTQSTEEAKPFFERPYQEEEGGYIDERGFYTSLNGSFWDNEHTYFNSLGFDKHGGSYDKYGIYIPGPNYDPKTNTYKEEEMNLENKLDGNKLENNKINGLSLKEKNDKITVKNYGDLVELDDEYEDDEEENINDINDISYDINDFEEALNDALDNDNNKSFDNNINPQNA